VTCPDITGYADRRAMPLCWRSCNADPRSNARNAAKPAKQTRPAFANVVQRGRSAERVSSLWQIPTRVGGGASAMKPSLSFLLLGEVLKCS
jgi:hypothetical protein